ncbi:YhdP family protein [Teredinibacter turnerae]|uniref:YhdP family phospholipid transporter n=1 Tax=Teredinibacter turnerae TaxID=2426 RepID=UPI0030D5D2BC
MRRLVKRFWGTLFTLVIATAVLVQLGREAFPLLNDYRDDISRLIGDQLGVKIHIGELAATWAGLRPKVDLIDVSVDSLDDQPIFRIREASMELSLVESLAKRQVAWRQLAFKDLQTTLVQQDTGPWQIKNLKTTVKSDRKFRIDDPLDIFLVGRRVEIDNAQFALEFRTGHQSSLQIPNIMLENDKDFHRIRASAAVEGRQHFTLISEGIGDPRDPDNFDAKGYVSLNQFPMEQVLAAFAGDWWREQGSHQWAEGHRLDLQLWYQGSSTRGYKLSGNLRADGLPLAVPETVSLPTGTQADITGSWTPKDGWRLMLQHLLIDWPEGQSPPLDVALEAGFNRPIGVRIPEVDLGRWYELLAATGSLTGRVGDILGQLKPQGMLRNLDVRFTDKASGYVLAKANMADVGVGHFRGAPELRHLDGYLEATALSGRVTLRSERGIAMNFVDLYDAPFEFDSARGQVAWQLDLDEKTAYVSSGRIELTQGELASSGYLHLALPLVADPREPQMTLAIGMREGPLSVHKSYVPKVVPSHLYEWLESSIGAGTATDAAFIYHGSVDMHPKYSANLQLSADVHNADLAFDPHWPALESLNGHINLDHYKLNVSVSSAELLGNQVNRAQVKLLAGADGQPMALAIKGAVTSNAAAAMALLQQSPVRSVFGSTFDSWTFGGNVAAEIELQVPLEEDTRGSRQLVNVEFDGAKVDMADIGLAVDSVKGKLQYSSETGLSSAALDAAMWGRPVRASIESPLVGDTARDTVIHFRGPVDVDDIRQWTQRPELGFVSGVTELDGSLTIPAEGTQPYYLAIDVASKLDGVSLELPAPMSKSAADKAPFNVSLKMFDDYQLYRFDYNKQISLRLRSGVNDSLQLNFGDTELPLQPGYFDVLGQVPTADLFEWDLVRERYFAYMDQLSTGTDDEATLPIRVNMDIGYATAGDIGVENVHVNGLGTETEWSLRVDSEPVAGDVVIKADDSSPVIMALDYLHLPGVDQINQDTAPDNSKPAPVAQEVAADVPVDKTRSSTTETPVLVVQSEAAVEQDAPAPAAEALIPGAEALIPVAEAPIPGAEAPMPGAEALPKSMMADIDLSTFFPVDFRVDALTVGGEPYGHWEFELRPIDQGVVIRNVHATIRGMDVGEAIVTADDPPDEVERAVPETTDTENTRRALNGKVSAPLRNNSPTVSEGDQRQRLLDTRATEFTWRQTPEGNVSSFRGTLMAKDVGKVLQAWGQEKIIESRTAVIQAEISWPGAPDEVALPIVSGKVDFNLLDGSFVRGATDGDNGLLRLIALFNFDTIARRLRLDFSDLAKEGLGFESVHGDFEFENGRIFIHEPLVVNSTSSKIQVAGVLDMLDETIDAELVATLPVAGDLTVAAALVAGLPAAVGVFLVSQMFEKQVDRASSLNYRINGGWDDPKIKFRKIFDDTAAEKKGREVQDMDRNESRELSTSQSSTSQPPTSQPPTSQASSQPSSETPKDVPTQTAAMATAPIPAGESEQVLSTTPQQDSQQALTESSQDQRQDRAQTEPAQPVSTITEPTSAESITTGPSLSEPTPVPASVATHETQQALSSSNPVVTPEPKTAATATAKDADRAEPAPEDKLESKSTDDPTPAAEPTNG